MFSQTIICGLGFLVLLATAATDTRLPDAAMQGNSARVRSLLKQKADVNVAQGDGMTALHWAAFQGDEDMVKALVAAGSNVNAVTLDGAITPLFLAAADGNSATLEVLLRASAQVNSANANGTTALMMAASSGNTNAVKALLDHEANVNAKEFAYGQTALMFAAARGRSAVIKLLIARGADANIATSVRETEKVRVDSDGHVMYEPPSSKKLADAKTVAADTRESNRADAAAHAQAAEQALKAATESAKSDLDLLSRALGFQSARFSLDRPRRTVASPVSPFRRVGPQFVGGMTALLYAARQGHMEATVALVEAGADLNQVNADNFSPLVSAISNGHLDLAKYLLERGADPNLATLSGLAALYAAVDVQWAPHASYPQPSTEQERIGYLELMKALLEHGAYPNVRLGEKLWFRSLFSDSTWVDPVGATPFWRAAQSSDVAAMRILVDHGADPKTPTKSGNTPLMAAAGVGWAANWSVNAPVPAIDAVKYCIEVGNDVNAVESRGYTALHGAAYIGDNDIVLYLVNNNAKVDVKTKSGDSPADMANGPTRFGQPHPETVALLQKLGSPNSHNCRSDQCVVDFKPNAEQPLSPAERVQKEALDTFAAVLGFHSAVYVTEAATSKAASSSRN